MSNINNGMLTKIWGPHLWESLNSIVFGYPINPTKEQKENYKNWLIGIEHILPCKYCRESYSKFVRSGYSELTEESLKNRENLCKWIYNIHNRINEKLGVDYKLTFKEFICKYESQRAKCVSKDNGCTMPVDLKAESYRKAEIRHAPVIDYEICKKFSNYAKLRGLHNFDIFLEKYNNMFINKDDRLDRDITCFKIIKYMRKNSIDCTESSGEFYKLPTIHELILLSMMCTNISLHYIDEIINRL